MHYYKCQSISLAPSAYLTKRVQACLTCFKLCSSGPWPISASLGYLRAELLQISLMLRICVIMYRTITQGFYRHKHVIRILSAEHRCKVFIFIRDRPRALKQTAPNLSIFQQTSNDEIAHCSTTCDRIMHVCRRKLNRLHVPSTIIIVIIST